MPSLQFKGKSIVQTLHLSSPYRQLLPDAAASLTARPRLDDNLIIQGDNLLALKALLPTYGGRVKCIFIDPPYNTGNENWLYNDNMNSAAHRDWLHKEVGKEDLLRHDKWLCMMWPRLMLLRDLLRQDGAIFVSIDDNEAHRLRLVMDEIFGEEHFVASIAWQKKYASANDHTGIAPMHDHILVYQRSDEWARNLLPRTEEKDRQYRYEDEGGIFRPDNYTCNKSADERPNLYYAITNPNTGEEIWPNRNRVWAYSREKYLEHVREGLVYWGKEGTASVPAFKRYRHALRGGGGTVPATWWSHDFAGHTDEAKKEIRTIFGSEDDSLDFITPKPTRLIQRVLQIATDAEGGDIVLDSFAGSGTTAHAVLALNAEDGGDRRFILVEQEAYAESLTAERVRRVIRGVPGAKDEALENGLDGSFSFFCLGEALDEAGMLSGERLPSYLEVARHAFFTATGEQLDESQLDEGRAYLGESRHYEVYLLYQPDIAYLKNHPLTLSWVEGLGRAGAKKRLVIAPHKYLDEERMRAHHVEYCQLPFALYRHQAERRAGQDG